jgi:glycosyltransferase involved in cell wall biosynthesis
MQDYTVALISHEYPPYTIGGIGSYCFSLATALARRRIRTVVFCGLSRVTEISKVNDCLEIVRMPYPAIPPRYLWFQIKNLRTILRHLGKNWVIHAVDPTSSALLVYLKKKLKSPFVTTVHEHPMAALKEFARLSLSEWSLGDFRISAASYPLDNFLMQACLRASDHIVVPGKYTKDYLLRVDRKISSEKVSVIYNGIDFEQIDKIQRRNDRSNGLCLISYGRLVSTKGFLYLVKIIPRLCQRFPGLNLKLVGKGPLEKKIVSKIRNSHVENMIQYEGFQPHSALIREVKNSDVVVLPTFHEVGPFISALEAMACKKTLVVFDLQFSREFIINMQNGIMAKALSTEDLYDKISLVLSDSNLRKELGENAYEYVKKHHNWDTLVNRYIRIYEESLHSSH